MSGRTPKALQSKIECSADKVSRRSKLSLSGALGRTGAALSVAICLSLVFGCDSETEGGPADMMSSSSDLSPGGDELDMDMVLIPDMEQDEAMAGDEADLSLDMLLDMETLDESLPDMEQGPPACQNGLDDDEDGATDYPRDPGCHSVDDDDEEDPALFECEDGIDNDGDGSIDLEDPGCSSERDRSEESACGPHEAIDISTRRRVVSDSEGEPAFFEACRSNNAPEQVFLFTLSRPVEYLYFSTEGSAFDTLLSVRRDCETLESEVACNDDVGSMSQTYSAVQLDRPALGDYYLIVDGYGESAGRVVLNIEAGVAEGETCPPEGGPLLCPRGQACNAEAVCAPAACADLEDNDGDDRTDYPSDPGCERPEDQDEADPEVAPECGDGADNDADGAIDFPNDAQCTSAADPREGSDPLVMMARIMTVMGSLISLMILVVMTAETPMSLTRRRAMMAAITMRMGSLISLTTQAASVRMTKARGHLVIYHSAPMASTMIVTV